MRTLLVLLSLVTCTVTYGLDAPLSSPEKVVLDFYAAEAKFPSVTNIEHAKPFSVFLSRSLYRSIQYALAADEAYLKENPTDKGFFGDGVAFVGSPDGYTSYAVKGVVPNGPHAARVAIQFSYLDQQKPKEWSFMWTNVILLIKEEDKWVIDDIEYQDGARLSFHLKQAVEEVRKLIQNERPTTSVP